MVKHILTAGVALMLTLGVAGAQQPATSADKVQAEKAAQEKLKASQQELERRSAEIAAAQAEAVARAQQKVADEARKLEEQRIRALEAKANEIVPVDIEVVVSRYQGDKKVSSLPYFLAVNAAERQEKTSLRMGASVPVPATIFTPIADGKASQNPVTSYNYQDVSTNIDCSARPLADGRFAVSIQVGERSIVESPNVGTGIQAPVIRNFNTSNNLVLRDGQTRQFTAAADRITGEVVKVDVTLKVVK